MTAVRDEDHTEFLIAARYVAGRLAKRFGLPPDEALSIAAESLLGQYRNYRREGGAPLKWWLCRYGGFKASERVIRDAARPRPLALDAAEAAGRWDSETGIDPLIAREETARLWSLIGGGSDYEIMRRRAEGRTFGSIANERGVTGEAVRVWYHRAQRNILRREREAALEGGGSNDRHRDEQPHPRECDRQARDLNA